MQWSLRERVQGASTHVLNAHVLAYLETIARLAELAHSFDSIATEISLTVRMVEEKKRTEGEEKRGVIRCILECGWCG